MKSNINLHIHTAYSDGGKTVGEIVDGLKAAGVKYFAVTDHDTVEGNVKAAELAKKYGMKYCNGVEISCCFSDGEIGLDASYVCHIVGLDFDLQKMQTEVEKLLEYKCERIRELFKALVADGYNLDEEAVFELAAVKRREKIGKELIAKDYAQTMNEAFENILNAERYSAFAKNVPSIKETIDIIHACGGLAVWAHPFGITRGGKKDLTEAQVTEFAKSLISYGIDGMEVYYQHYTAEQIRFLEGIANEHRLWKSIGTDYHGAPEDKIFDPAYAAKVREQLYFEAEGITPDACIVEALKARGVYD
ncbi:MAG: PHP domain-containing protein [Firmicutes bacterium]|nr:PHP domain-containing protein [Bacillota bacterium]